MRPIRLAPVTAEAIIICVVIFVSCAFQASAEHRRFTDVQRKWGAISSLTWFESFEGVRRTNELELNGPLDVWDGDWWRIPITPLHHANLPHLVLTMAATWYMGSRLERYWGSWTMGLFLVPACCLPVMGELCLGQAVIGFTSVACAMFGALIVLRGVNERVASEFPAESVLAGVAAIFLCWLATLTDTASFALPAYIVGFSYGGLIAAISSRWTNPISIIMLLIFLQIGLIPCLIFVSHPYWIGRYHWRRAIFAQNYILSDRHLKRAIEVDPSLAGAWLRWAQLAESDGNPLESWKRVVNGLYFNPSSQGLMEGAQRQWRHFDVYQRQRAELVLARFFGERSILWLNQLRVNVTIPRDESNENTRTDEPEPDLRAFSLDQKVELPELDLFSDQSKPKDHRIPLQRNDAVEGESL